MIWNDCVIVGAARSIARVVRGRVGGVVAILLLSLLSVGCNTDKDTAAKIARAEAIAEEHPDSALRIVRSIDAERVRGKHDRAHYQLVVAEAHYYNYLIPDRKTIAQPLFDYYIDSDNHAERARALYQYALVMQSEGEKARAMYSLLEAEESLSHINNPRLAGLVHRTKGYIYGKECLFQNALEEFQKSKECFDRAELPFHSAYALYNIATAYGKLREFDRAIGHLLSAEAFFSELNYSTYLYDVQIELCYNYIQIEDYEQCNAVLSRIENDTTKIYSLSDYYYISALMSAYNSDYSSADDMINLAKEEYIVDPMRLKYIQYLVSLQQGDHAKALLLHNDMIEEQDEHVFNAINNSLLQSQIELLSTQIESAKELQIKTRHINYLLILLILGIASSVVYYIINRQQKHQAEIAQSMAIASELRNILTLKDSEILSQQNIIEQLFASRFDTIDKLSCAYFEAQGSNNEKQRIYCEVSSLIDDISTDKKAIKKMEDFVDNYKDSLMTKFRSSIPNATEDDTQLFLYLALGFSPRAISIFMKKSVDAVYNLKSRLRHKIIKSNSQYKEKLLGVM